MVLNESGQTETMEEVNAKQQIGLSEKLLNLKVAVSTCIVVMNKFYFLFY